MNKYDIRITIAWIVLTVLAFSSCNADKQLAKRIEKAKVVAYQNPKAFAEFCNVSYPSIYKIGKDSIITRTVTVKGDSIPCPESNGVIPYVKCPDVKVVYKDVLRIDTVNNTAKEQTLKNEIDLLKAENSDLRGELKAQTTLKDEAKDNSGKKTWWIVTLGIVLLVSLYGNVRNIFL